MLPADMAMGSVEGVFQDIDLDQDVAEQLLKILKDGIDTLDSQEVGAVPANSFGAGSTGQNLGYHTGLAYQKVTDALLEMVETLGHTEQSINKYMDTQEYNDYSSRVAIANVMDRLNGVLPGTPFTETITDGIRRGDS